MLTDLEQEKLEAFVSERTDEEIDAITEYLLNSLRIAELQEGDE
jgi:hypothetical protein